MGARAFKEQPRKIQREFVYRGFGFPVVLLDVRMVRVRGQWTPDVDYEALSRQLLLALASKPARLTGDEIHFIRHSLGMTLKDFAGRFGGVSHPAVLKWEQAGAAPTTMNWAVEKDVRLEILRSAGQASPAAFVEAYEALVKEPAAKPSRPRLQVGAA